MSTHKHESFKLWTNCPPHWVVAVLAILVHTVMGCDSPPSGNSHVGNAEIRDGKSESTIAQEPATHSMDSSFARYLRFFSDIRPLEQWPEDALDQLVLHGEIWNQDKTDLNFVLQNYFHKIDPVLLRHIPNRRLKDLAKKGAEIQNPLSRYELYAFAKLKRDSYWLVSIFALKREMEQQVYNRHPFLLATYSSDSSWIDDYVWWTIIDDDIQVCDDVDVSGDTLLVGRKEDINQSELSEVYEKVVITNTGKFKTVYQNIPEGYLKDD